METVHGSAQTIAQCASRHQQEQHFTKVPQSSQTVPRYFECRSGIFGASFYILAFRRCRRRHLSFRASICTIGILIDAPPYINQAEYTNLENACLLPTDSEQAGIPPNPCNSHVERSLQRNVCLTKSRKVTRAPPDAATLIWSSSPDSEYPLPVSCPPWQSDEVSGKSSHVLRHRHVGDQANTHGRLPSIRSIDGAPDDGAQLFSVHNVCSRIYRSGPRGLHV